MASSSEPNVFTQRTGPKTSSLQICMEVVTLLMMVGSMKNPFFKCCKFTIHTFEFLTYCDILKRNLVFSYNGKQKEISKIKN